MATVKDLNHMTGGRMRIEIPSQTSNFMINTDLLSAASPSCLLCAPQNLMICKFYDAERSRLRFRMMQTS